ncbi:MAG: dihydrolipoyllysine-residue acetyltransferase [Trueperaceae bacterium]|nr:dihydrolipoyllysine-residue acetyltransferase [Trueperaceae bacterium]
MATEFKLPEVGEGIEAGTVVSILVSVGDKIEEDQPVLELETDKAVVEVPSSVSGVVQTINVKENEEATVGQVILTVDEAGAAPAKDETPAKEEAPAQEAKAEEKPAEQPAERPAPTQADTAEQAQRVPGAYEGPVDSKKPVPAAPSVRRLAREMGVDIRDISGSGLLGRISAQDVKRYAETGQVAPSAPAAPAQAAPQTPQVTLPDFSKFGEVRREPMSGIRKATVRAMATAWATVPMVTNVDKADITEFEALRKKYKPRAEAAGAKLTPTAMLLKVVAGALRKFPDFNASIDVENNEVIYKDYVNVGVAVDTERGLLVPVIRNADRKGIIQLAVDLGEMAQKARDRKLSPDDMQGGNFSISNLGGIGGTNFTPIVNPPDVAILGVSKGEMEPVWDKDAGEFKPRMRMPLSLTYDHRLIDGANAARFLRYLCEAIEDPFLMALEG